MYVEEDEGIIEESDNDENSEELEEVVEYDEEEENEIGVCPPLLPLLLPNSLLLISYPVNRILGMK